jgi:hypothetical protein
MTDRSEQAMGEALAGGAIASATLEALFDKGIITLDEGRGILDKAARSLGPVIQTAPGGHQAIQIIGALQRGKFSTRG